MNWLSVSVCFVFLQNFAAQMAGGFDEKAGGAQMGVMQGPMVSSTVYTGYISQEEYVCMVLICKQLISYNDLITDI